ncbi:type II toxin-antitoxin system ParD family antitoxin [Salegentibacter sp. HM20]
MTRKTKIQLDPYFEEFIRNEITAGKYDSVSEVVNAGLKMLEESEKLKALRQAIQEGIDSGIDEEFDSHLYCEMLKNR